MVSDCAQALAQPAATHQEEAHHAGGDEGRPRGSDPQEPAQGEEDQDRSLPGSHQRVKYFRIRNRDPYEA